MRSRPHVAPLLPAILLASLASIAQLASAQPAPEQPAPAAASGAARDLAECDRLAQDGDRASRQRLFDAAHEAYSSAIECSGEATRRLAYSLARTSLELGRFDEAEEQARVAIAAADRDGEREGREISVSLLGNILGDGVRWTVEPIDEQARLTGLRAAEQVFREVVAGADEESGLKSATRDVGWFNLAVVLAAQDRLSDAGEVAAVYVERQPRGPFVEPSRQLVDCAERLAEGGPPPTVDTGSLPEPVWARPPVSMPADVPESRVPETLELEAVIDRCGSVRSLRPVSEVEPAIARAAMRAVRWWRFEPVERDGQEVNVRGKLTVVFRPH